MPACPAGRMLQPARPQRVIHDLLRLESSINGVPQPLQGRCQVEPDVGTSCQLMLVGCHQVKVESSDMGCASYVALWQTILSLPCSTGSCWQRYPCSPGWIQASSLRMGQRHLLKCCSRGRSQSHGGVMANTLPRLTGRPQVSSNLSGHALDWTIRVEASSAGRAVTSVLGGRRSSTPACRRRT